MNFNSGLSPFGTCVRDESWSPSAPRTRDSVNYGLEPPACCGVNGGETPPSLLPPVISGLGACVACQVLNVGGGVYGVYITKDRRDYPSGLFCF